MHAAEARANPKYALQVDIKSGDGIIRRQTQHRAQGHSRLRQDQTRPRTNPDANALDIAQRSNPPITDHFDALQNRAGIGVYTRRTGAIGADPDTAQLVLINRGD